MDGSSFAREYTFDATGEEYNVYTAPTWSKVMVVNRGTGVGSFTLNRKKRSAWGFYEDAFQLIQNIPVEMVLAEGDILYVQGQSADLIEVTAGPMPFADVLGPRPFPAMTETRTFALGGSGVNGVRVSPDEFCEVHLSEASGAGNRFVVGINTKRIEAGSAVENLDGGVVRFKINRGDILYVAGKDADCEVNVLVTALPVLAGLVGELVC